MTNSTRMLEAAWAGDGASACSSDRCGKPILFLDKYFIDALSDRIYCHQCGLCLRYARKKALERGEPPEAAEV